MKTRTNLIRWAGILFVALWLVGCAGTKRTTGTAPATTVTDFKIVEQSSARELTPAERAQIQVAVESFLAGREAGRSGVYEIRVSFTPEQPGQPGEWVIVRISRLVVESYAMVASHPMERRGYEYYADRYGRGPWGGDFSDPLYSGYGYYYPSPRGPDRRPPPDGSQDHNRPPAVPRPEEPPVWMNRPPVPQVPPDRPPFEQRSRTMPDRRRDEDREKPRSPFEGRGRGGGHEPAPRPEPAPRAEPPPPAPPPPPPAPERSFPERSGSEVPRETGRVDLRSRLE